MQRICTESGGIYLWYQHSGDKGRHLVKLCATQGTHKDPASHKEMVTYKGQNMAVHTCNASTWRQKYENSPSLRSAWFTYQVPGQLEIQDEMLSQTKQKTNKPHKTVCICIPRCIHRQTHKYWLF